MGRRIKPYEHIVQYYETDRMKITHHSNYIRFMEEARGDWMEQLGFGYKKMEDEGIISPVVSVSCEYKKTTTYMDKIQISVNVLNLTPIKLTVSYVMRKDDVVVCKGESSHCFLNEKGRPIRLDRQFPEFYAILEEELDQ
ncbi:hypothetical protein P261_00739 [Lachnospiraceae bacterium TWA4]|nr:hypothetical protein P261_00739 [Lachnospiraceae bacterium TWA4]